MNTHHNFLISPDSLTGDIEALKKAIDPTGQVKLGDEGIGLYEYWGSKSNSSQLTATLEGFNEVSVNLKVLDVEAIDIKRYLIYIDELLGNLENVYEFDSWNYMDHEDKRRSRIQQKFILSISEPKIDAENKVVAFSVFWE